MVKTDGPNHREFFQEQLKILSLLRKDSDKVRKYTNECKTGIYLVPNIVSPAEVRLRET